MPSQEHDATPPRVFISYSHDSPEHATRVLQLADKLRELGIDAWVDQYDPHPPEGWPLWMERQVKQANFVLLICTERYHRRTRGEEVSGVGKGVAWESILIASELYENPHHNAKFIPVLFAATDSNFIPAPLKVHAHYVLDHFELSETDVTNFEKLYRRLTNQPATAAAALGVLRKLSSQRSLAPRGSLERSELPSPIHTHSVRRIDALTKAQVLLNEQFPVFVQIRHPDHEPLAKHDWPVSPAPNTANTGQANTTLTFTKLTGTNRYEATVSVLIDAPDFHVEPRKRTVAFGSDENSSLLTFHLTGINRGVKPIYINVVDSKKAQIGSLAVTTAIEQDEPAQPSASILIFTDVIESNKNVLEKASMHGGSKPPSPIALLTLTHLIYGLLLLLSAFAVVSYYYPYHVEQRSASQRVLILSALSSIKMAVDVHNEANSRIDNIHDETGSTLLSWRARLLPYLEREELWNEIGPRPLSWDAEDYSKLRNQNISAFSAGNVKIGDTAIVAIKTDGELFSSKLRVVLLYVEDSGINWLEPRDFSLDDAVRYISQTPKGVPVCLADGSAYVLVPGERTNEEIRNELLDLSKRTFGL